MSMPARVTLQVDSVGSLGKLMPASQAGLLVPTDYGFKKNDPIEIDLVVAGKSVALTGTVAELDVPFLYRHDRVTVVRTQLDRKSWKKLFVNVCRAPWRRKEDFTTKESRRRSRVQEAGLCYIPRTGQRFIATLIEVSDGGAFISLPAANVEPGEELRFRGSNEPNWHSAQVRWQGSKSDQSGVGVALAFENESARDRWGEYLKQVRMAA
ncbi:MAG: hypothetical protein AUK47_17915 [Deltaproteobacteria bacterium CG2_30_63_29]|nr:MAG: hypothetical protein AUK47_17915 [Deltaproteobacteria bacterium CG2_30_63_29]PIV99685.1 MAG: hypothetical protein COW42_10235 [Deltaproteobacteria bacterium CG17_big_fil_post_rev_8_21_14_2_50_63_7]PJB44877.1 MAG: hypothetical protein CO108_08110 [Deltaproteobacteria bacterium CG_4_9_14_3_um_filter_63_12]